MQNVRKVTVEVYQKAKDRAATGGHHWNPDSKETADHSIPYVVAATLMDGSITPRSFNDAHLASAELRALLGKTEVFANPEFTKAFEQRPARHHARVTVELESGERLVGVSTGGGDDLSAAKSDEQIAAKFRGLTEDLLGAKRTREILERLWHLESEDDVAHIPPAFVLD